MTTFRALYPSELTSVAQARQAVSAFACRCGFCGVDVADIALAVGEACNNAVEHGHVDRGHFCVICDYDGGVLRVEIQDDGPGFDAAAAAVVVSAPDVMGRGRGISIMRAITDCVTLTTGQSGTKVVFEKRNSASRLRETLSESGRFQASSFG